MIKIVALNKTTMLTIMFVIIMMPYSSTSKIIGNIYKLPLLNETYDSYQWRSGLNKNSYKYDKVFDEEQFFHIEYNLKFRRLPTNPEDENYESYKADYENYCKNKYRSFKASAGEIQLNIFKNTVIKLMGCLNTNDKGVKEKTLRETLEDCLVEPNKGSMFRNLINIKSVTDGLGKSVKINCLIKNLSNDQKKNFLGCMDDIAETPQAVNTKSSEKSKLTEDKKLKMLHTKDLNLLKDVISEELSLNNISTITAIFQNYTRIKPAVAVNYSAKYINDSCLFYLMSEVLYNVTRKIYEILLNSLDDDFKKFVTRLSTIIPDLNNASKNNQSIMLLKNNLETITYKRYDKFKKSIRAMEEEDDYTLYAMRLIIKGYMPLTNELWINERSYLHIYKTDIELEEDSLANENN